jgi:HPt (histidine-containing phosphotransfer) domain-containing protein
MRRMGGNIKLIRKLIERFAETQADAMTRIKAAIDTDDLPSAIRDTHTTRGLAGNIGATQLMALAAEVEVALKHNQMTALPSAFAAMAQELHLVITQIAAATGIPAASDGRLPDDDNSTTGTPGTLSTSAAIVDREALRNQLHQLATLLVNNDTRAGKLVDSMSATLHGIGQSEVGVELNQLIAEYEFEKALARLTATAQALNIEL